MILVHAIEQSSIPDLGAQVRTYAGRTSLVDELRDILGDASIVAMEYSKEANNPYISKVDAGTVDLVRSFGISVVGSGNLLQSFVTWSEANLRSHRRAARVLATAKDDALDFIRERLAHEKPVAESDVQSVIRERFSEAEMVFDHPPVVVFGKKTNDPHYVVGTSGPRSLRSSEPILMDLWCREPGDDGVYADITWIAHCGEPDNAFSEVFALVLAARDKGISMIQDAVEQELSLQGCQLDCAVRGFIIEAGYGHGLLHRTGQSLGADATHGEAFHLDDFETRDERNITPGVAVTVEPGVYLPRFGVRSEVDVFVSRDAAEVTTILQKELDILKA